MIFDHVGLFIADLASGREQMLRTFGKLDIGPEIDDPGLKVRVQFLTDSSGIRYELVAPFGEGNPVSGVLAAGNTILNHLAYRVHDLDVEISRMRKERAMPLGQPACAVAFGGSRVIFFLLPMKFIVELIEDRAIAS